MGNAELYHHGIKGQRWGFRRWQNDDGSLTEAGRAHYGVKEARIAAKNQRAAERAQYKLQKAQNRAYAKAQKAEAKELKRSQKVQRKIEEIELEKAKVSLQRMKQDAAYNNGKKFGDAFIPALGRSLGEGFGRTAGEMMGNLANVQKWKQLETDRINAETARTNARNTKMDKELAAKKYDEGFDDRKQAIDKLIAENTKYSNTTDRIRAETDRQKANDASEQQKYNLSEEGRARAAQKLSNETAKIANQSKQIDYDTSDKGHERRMAELANERADIRVKSKNADIGKTKADADLERSHGDRALKEAEAKNYLDKQLTDREIENTKQREITRLEAKDKLDYKRHIEDVGLEKLKDNNRTEVEKRQIDAKDKLDLTKAAAKDRQAERDSQYKMAELANQWTLKGMKENNAHAQEMARIEKGISSSTKIRQQTARDLQRKLDFAMRVKNNPNASDSQKAIANGYLAAIRSFNNYSDDIGDVLTIPMSAINRSSR